MFRAWGPGLRTESQGIGGHVEGDLGIGVHRVYVAMNRHLKGLIGAISTRYIGFRVGASTFAVTGSRSTSGR